MARRGIARLVTAVDETDPEADPLTSMAMELRRTVAAIKYYEEQIATLNEDEAFWGTVKETEVGATEFPGTNTEYAANSHVYIAAWERERAHLLNIHKLYVAARVDEKTFRMQLAIIDKVEKVVTNVVVGLGRDPRDPEVRKVVRASVLELKDAEGAPRELAYGTDR